MAERDERGKLEIRGCGNIEVEFVAAYLSDLINAYNCIFFFEMLLDNPYPKSPLQGLASRRYFFIDEWRPEDASSFIPHQEQLVLLRVQLSSPGFWEFLGKLNPLEVIRQYVNDRHERRKDREYRESAEERRLYLQNLELENRVLRDRIQIAKEIGAKDTDLAPLLNGLIYRPLNRLDRHQDRGLIKGAELTSHYDDKVD